MPTTEELPLGNLLSSARFGLGASLEIVARDAGCSPAYVHKLEQNRVKSPSPRVLAGLATALGLEYRDVMRAAGYEPNGDPSAPVVTPQRFSNADIVVLLEDVQREVRGLRDTVQKVLDRR